MAAAEDRGLMYKVIERQLMRHGELKNWTELERVARVSHPTMHRIKKAEPTVEEAHFRRIETALGMPYDSLGAVGTHDLAVLREMGVEPDLLAWIERAVKSSRKS